MRPQDHHAWRQLQLHVAVVVDCERGLDRAVTHLHISEPLLLFFPRVPPRDQALPIRRQHHLLLEEPVGARLVGPEQPRRLLCLGAVAVWAAPPVDVVAVEHHAELWTARHQRHEAGAGLHRRAACARALRWRALWQFGARRSGAALSTRVAVPATAARGGHRRHLQQVIMHREAASAQRGRLGLPPLVARRAEALVLLRRKELELRLPVLHLARARHLRREKQARPGSLARRRRDIGTLAVGVRAAAIVLQLWVADVDHIVALLVGSGAPVKAAPAARRLVELVLNSAAANAVTPCRMQPVRVVSSGRIVGLLRRRRWREIRIWRFVLLLGRLQLRRERRDVEVGVLGRTLLWSHL